ncbi:glutamine synthetase family protein [Actinophytocola sp.]|uniref:glutamine synthetase family protein n=1 Tax=Actinophytocola sp. TaxID=1872138 RepID=UPI002D7F2FE9|nr:glutamine synthetase family protein [Actinophytocola sp.]HET9141297.1 glutamine synthetase family protein [Actinophytocola sp.]
MHVLGAVARNAVELVRFMWVDHSGVLRGKAVAADTLAGRMRSGVGVATVRQAASLLDQAQPVAGFPVMDEVRLMPDPDTFVLLPHSPGSAAMLCDLWTRSGAPWAACPRTFLRDAVGAAGALGYQVVAAFEPEFTLAHETGDGTELALFDDGLCLDNEAFDAANDYIVALSRALRSQGIEVEMYHPETSAGQHELSIRHAEALRAADNHVWQRAFTRGMARRRGMRATFAPVPRPGLRGNGNHLHLSLWRDGANAFAEQTGALGLSDLARHFIGGVLAHLPGLMALTCASVNSYLRLEPGKWAGAFGCYGPDNRDAAIRVPSTLRGKETASTNIELKVCDATANPYLALGATIQAGLDGVRNRLDPGAPLTEDPNRLSDAELRRRGVRHLPRSLEEAVAALERDELLMAVLGSPRRELCTAVKRADVRDFKEMSEIDGYVVHSTRF